ncbi:N-acetylmuramoyl-L-alanine amidase [Peribacillus sp. NPDC097224]|uniref:N-acetylmuramoyl-L-alanine amidase n=1 Tax=Peribacillus sp. NPDC097224 TaxID=3364399 RepID=UPI00382151FF
MKVVLDAGHGYSTPGKRSPDGMKEYEFNRETAAFIKHYLEKSKGITVYYAHEDERDVPLGERTRKSHALGADLYLSIHANAAGSGKWHEANGIETYVHTSKPKESLSLAEKVQHDLVKATHLKNRGVKTANFQVLRETKCPALLIECGFMTNQQEAALLRTEAFRKTCGESIAKSVLAHYKLKNEGSSTILYKVQIGAFTDKKKAETLVKKLAKDGYDAFITKQT